MQMLLTETPFYSVFLSYKIKFCPAIFQRLSVQEVPPLLNGDSGRSQQQQRVLPSSQSDTCTAQGSPHFFRSLAFGGGAAGGSSQGSSPQHASTPVSTSASPLPDASSGPTESAPATSGSSAQQNPLLLTNTSNLSPCLIPSTVMSLSQLSPTSSSLQGTTVPIPHSAPHSPPLPHSAPLSRAMTPVQLLHQQVGPGGSNTLSTSHNPWFLKTTEMSATATLPLPRRPASEMRLGGFQGESSHIFATFIASIGSRDDKLAILLSRLQSSQDAASVRTCTRGGRVRSHSGSLPRWRRRGRGLLTALPAR